RPVSGLAVDASFAPARQPCGIADRKRGAGTAPALCKYVARFPAPRRFSCPAGVPRVVAASPARGPGPGGSSPSRFPKATAPAPSPARSLGCATVSRAGDAAQYGGGRGGGDKEREIVDRGGDSAFCREAPHASATVRHG